MTINQTGGPTGGSIRPVGPIQAVQAAAAQASVQAAPKPAGDVSQARSGWPPAASDDDWPAYPALFGSAPYVAEGARLQDMLAAAKAAGLPGDVVGLQKALGVKADDKYGPITHGALVAYLQRAEGKPPELVAPAVPTPAPVPAGPTPAPGTAAPPALFPPRAPDAIGGREFLARTAHMTPAQREEAIMQEILAGNVPDALRQPREIEVRTKLKDGREVVGKVQVLPDYLAIGSDADQVRIPMNPLTAQKIADRLGMSLPTRKLVDDVYAQADTKLKPQPLPAGPQMMSNAYYQRHADAVDQQLAGRSGLVAGHKKDVVISNQVAQHPGKVAIYGWHQPDGKPIQGLSTVHEETYADYSHGIRLVGGTMTVDGREVPVAEVLADPELSKLLSDEGPIKQPRYRA